ncbi:hypothetical protein DFQ26_008120 [Actinomortierella ambigua]|nr:hypothetical protein DFQ26_008120 [Actinomortierella ambigua]
MSLLRTTARIGHHLSTQPIHGFVKPSARMSTMLAQYSRLQHRNNVAPILSEYARASFHTTFAQYNNNQQQDSKPAPASMDSLAESLKAPTKGAKSPEDVHPPPTSETVAAMASLGGGAPAASSEDAKTLTAGQEKPQGKFQAMWNKGKAIVIQCKDGVKLLWVNRKIVKELKRQVKDEGYQLSRREYQLIRSTDIDVKRLIPFAAIFVLATEYIPLIILFAPGMIPSTCVTHDQLESRRKKLHEKRCAMTEKLILMNRREITKESLASYSSFLGIAKRYGDSFELAQIDRQHLSSFCKFMGLNGWGPRFMLKNRLEKHMAYLAEDDALLQRDQIDSLTFLELQAANEERGMRSLEVSRDHLERSLAYWLSLTQNKEQPIPPGLMVFSRMFLLHASFK